MSLPTTTPVEKNPKLVGLYSDYVRERMQYVDSRSTQFKRQQSAVKFEVRELRPSLVGAPVYLGQAIDRTGGEVDHPPTRFDQTAFIATSTGPIFLDFFQRSAAEDGSESWSDLPFCSQHHLVTIGKSVCMACTAKEREQARKDLDKSGRSECRSMLPELRARLRFDAGPGENAARLEELSAFLTLLLIEHQAGGPYIRGLHSTLAWALGGDRLPNRDQWALARDVDAGAIGPLAVSKVGDGFEARGFAVLDESVLVQVELKISPAAFAFRLRPRGAIPYGP